MQYNASICIQSNMLCIHTNITFVFIVLVRQSCKLPLLLYISSFLSHFSSFHEIQTGTQTNKYDAHFLR